MPRRVQRSRAKGWRLPEGAVYVGRPTAWGNPFRVGGTVYRQDPLFRHAAEQIRHGFLNTWVVLDHPESVVAAYRSWLTDDHGDAALHLRSELRAGALGGRDLCCWCPPDRACHADVLLELANQPAVP